MAGRSTRIRVALQAVKGAQQLCRFAFRLSRGIRPRIGMHLNMPVTQAHGDHAKPQTAGQLHIVFQSTLKRFARFTGHRHIDLIAHCQSGNALMKQRERETQL
jgi:hypothetical protein